MINLRIDKTKDGRYFAMGKFFDSEEQARDVAKSRQERAGRELNRHELAGGVMDGRPQDLTRAERRVLESYKPKQKKVEKPDPLDLDAYPDVLADRRTNRVPTRAERRRHIKREQEAKRYQEELAAEDEASRAPAVEYSNQLLEQILWSPQVPESFVLRAQAIAKQSKADLEEWQRMVDEFQKDYGEWAKQASVDNKEARLEVQREAKRKEKMLSPPSLDPNGLPPNERYSRVTKYGGEKVINHYRVEGDKEFVVNSWPADSPDAPTIGENQNV